MPLEGKQFVQLVMTEQFRISIYCLPSTKIQSRKLFDLFDKQQKVLTSQRTKQQQITNVRLSERRVRNKSAVNNNLSQNNIVNVWPITAERHAAAPVQTQRDSRPDSICSPTPRFAFHVINQIRDNPDIHYR